MAISQKLLCIIMDGVGVSKSPFGNAVLAAKTPALDSLKKSASYLELKAHGIAVGLPSDQDIGNSEVGHNTIGAGKVYDQGAKLVEKAIANQSIFEGDCWKTACKQVLSHSSTLHFIGLLSDGNVHSHEKHLHAMLKRAKQDLVNKVRLHLLFDGRDVSEHSAEIYIERLNKVISSLRSSSFDIEIASGGGRMHITMDRYSADWQMVSRGWQTHVLAKAEHHFSTIQDAIQTLRQMGYHQDQYLPSFTLGTTNPCGPIVDFDSVIFFNFRGDRAIEISRAFCEENLTEFDRIRFPNVYYAGMLEYDGDLKIPTNYLVSPPQIDYTLTNYLIENQVRQYACSETQKYGHVTYFWNGNRSGLQEPKLESYVEVPSPKIDFAQIPHMSAEQITESVIHAINHDTFDFGRVNFANGDMVGHTGNYQATISAIETVDRCIGQLMDIAKKRGLTLVITADHGNAEEMFEGKESDFPDWQTNPATQQKINAKTSHTLNPVPFFVFNTNKKIAINPKVQNPGLANIANTILFLMGIKKSSRFEESLFIETQP